MQEELGDRMAVTTRVFMLRPEIAPEPQLPPSYITEGMKRVRENAAIDTDIVFTGWPADRPMPRGSLPAQEAALAAQAQGPEAFDRMSHALFQAYFTDLRDISDRDVLVAIATEQQLDIPRFTADLDGHVHATEAMNEHFIAQQQYGISGVPALVINDRWKIVGAVPLADYREAFRRLLSGELD